MGMFLVDAGDKCRLDAYAADSMAASGIGGAGVNGFLAGRMV